MYDVGPRIVEIRKAKKLSQNRLAKEAGIGQSTLSAIESGVKNPSIETVRLLASALGCSAACLLGEDGNEKTADDVVSGLQEEAVTLLRSLPESAKDQAVQYLRFLASQQEK